MLVLQSIQEQVTACIWLVRHRWPILIQDVVLGI